MKRVSRRALFGMMTAGAALATSSKVYATDSPAKSLTSLTKGVQPITAQEHGARIAKVQSLMQQRKVAALLVEAGSSLEYFTGIHWWRSERTTAALIPANGGVIVVTPFFEEPSVRESLKIAADVRPWQEDESPFDLIVSALRDRVAAQGPLAVEATTRFFIIDHITKAWGAGREVISGDELCVCAPYRQIVDRTCIDAVSQRRHPCSVEARARTDRGGHERRRHHEASGGGD